MKKVEKDLQSGRSVREFTLAAEAEKHRERLLEVEKVQRRREEKEAEKERMEEELVSLFMNCLLQDLLSFFIIKRGSTCIRCLVCLSLVALDRCLLPRSLMEENL